MAGLSPAGMSKGQPGVRPMTKGQPGRFQMLPRPGSLTKGIPGVFQTQPRPLGATPTTLPRPGLITKGTPGVFQTQPRPPGATPTTLPPAGTTPAQPAPAPGGTDTPSALDSTYFANVAANQFKANNSINALNLQGSQDRTALQTALGQLAYQQPRDQLRLEQAANSRGALYSTPYAQQQGDLTHGYAMRQSAAQQNFANQMDRINAQIAALQGGEGLYESGQAAGAATRAANRAASNPAATAPAPPPGGPLPPGTVIRDVTRVTPAQQLAKAIAARPVVSLKPTSGKGRPRQVVQLRPVPGKGRPR